MSKNSVAVDPDAVVLHTYLGGAAVALGIAFGAAWALIPIALGIAALLVANG